MQLLKMKSPPDLNDVHYDAFLTNYHTVEYPELVEVKPDSVIRLRFINSAVASNFWITLGGLRSKAIAFDGHAIQAFIKNKFQLAMGQRIDILVKIPKTGGAFPILGQVEGTNQQTGLILVTPHANIPKLNETTTFTAPALNYQQEFLMKSLRPLPIKPIQQVVTLNLSGTMKNYIWKINGYVWPRIKPIILKQGERVEVIINNDSNMAHPMHLHGNIFEILSINHKKIQDGPLHDTILVLPHTQIKLIFDANTPGKWLLHCHMSYHMAAGMMTLVIIKEHDQLRI